MEKKIGKLNFCVALFALISCVVVFYTQFMGIFQGAEIATPELSVAYIIYYVCGLAAVAGLLWVAIAAILDASKGKRMNVNVPFYGFAIFGMSMLVKYLVFMQAINIWDNANMWIGVILGLFVLGASLFAILFGGRALNIMGFVLSAVLVGYFAFKAVGFLNGPAADFEQFFVYIVLAALFVFTSLAYTKQLTKPLPAEPEPTVKKVEKK